MPQYLAPICNDQTFDANGDPLNGGQIETYLAGSSTPAATYTDEAGLVQQSNPIVLNSLGFPTLGPIWLTGGIKYKFIIKTSLGVTLRTIDNIAGINDASVSQSEWVESGLTPTYISATSFSVPGDQTGILQISRRLRTQNTSGFIFSSITNSVFAAGVTTVTVANDSGVLDAGLSSVAYALLSADDSSIPAIGVTRFTMATNRILGRKTAATGAVEELTPADAKSVIAPPRGYVAGLTMSTAGASTTMTVAAGEAADSTAAALLSLAASLAKTTGAWAVGAAVGGLDTGAIANSTWYHFHLIRRPDTGVVDVLFSLSATAPTLPANYTQFRRIGSGFTNGSAQWTSFIQTGDLFEWVAPSAEAFSVTTTTPTLRTLTRAPSGVSVIARLGVSASNSGGGIANVQHWNPALGASVPLASGQLQVFVNSAVLEQMAFNVDVVTDTTGRVYNTTNAAVSTYTCVVTGWTDARGRNA